MGSDAQCTNSTTRVAASAAMSRAEAEARERRGASSQSMIAPRAAHQARVMFHGREEAERGMREELAAAAAAAATPSTSNSSTRTRNVD